MNLRPSHHDELGSTLLIALFFATIFSLLVVSVVTFTDAGLKASGAFVGQGKTAYSAVGATDAAIRRFSMGNACGDYTSPQINGHAMIVHCDNLSAPGAAPSSTSSSSLLSLGAEGIQATANMAVLGNVFSNSTINAMPGGSMLVSGNVSATGTCNRVTQPPHPASQSPYTYQCAPTSPADPALGADPDLSPPATSVPVLRTVLPTACPGPAGWLVALAPGYYDNAAALSALTDGHCHNAVVWLQPGIYYFDFTFTGGSGLWSVNDKTVNVVGGTPAGWDPLAASGPRPTISDPGGCNNTDPHGVQLMMGGGSRLQVDSGQVELCAPAGQAAALYGVPAARATHSLKPTATSAVAGFANPDHALTIGEKATLPGCSPLPTAGTTGCTADATLGSATGTLASMNLSGFAPGVPSGSHIDSVTLQVMHEERDDLVTMGTETVTAQFPGNTCGTDPSHTNGKHVLSRQPGGLLEDHIHLDACGLTDPSQLVNLTVNYAVDLGAGTSGADRLDGVAIDVGYRTPTTFKPTTVVAAAGFANPDNAKEIGEQPMPLTADAALSSPANTAASLTLAGYDNPPLPLGSTLDAAVLQVVHHEGGTTAPTVAVHFNGSTCDGTAGKPAVTVPRQSAVTYYRIDLLASCGLTADASTLSGLTATYDVTLGSDTNATDALDGIWLELVAKPPAPRQATTVVNAINFTNADPNALSINGASANADLSPTGNTTASISLTGYVTPTSPPPGSVIESAVVHVAHLDTGSLANPGALKVTIPFNGNTCGTGVHSLPQHAALDTNGQFVQDTVDLTACGLTDPSQLNGFTVAYTAILDSGGTSATDKLDGISIDLVYRPPVRKSPTTATSTGSSTTAAFVNPDSAKGIDNTTATATLTVPTASDPSAPTAPSASIQLGGFTTLPFPPGWVIDKAVLAIAHQDDDTTTPTPTTASPPTPKVSLTGPGFGGPCATPLTLTTRQGAIGIDTVDLRGLCKLTDQQLTDPSLIGGLIVTYSAALASPSTSATDQLDGVELDIVVRAPAIEPVGGLVAPSCLTATHYPSSGSCALIKVTDTADTATDKTRFVVQGAVYAPSAALDISMSQVTSQVLTGGLVARAIRLGITPVTTLFTTYPAVIQVPNAVTSPVGFSNPDNALVTGEQPSPPTCPQPPPQPPPAGTGCTADATVSSAAPTASLELRGYDHQPPLSTAPLDHAILRVTHQDDGAMGSVSVSVAFAGDTSTSGSACDAATGHPALRLPLRAGALVEDQVDLTADCGLGSTSQLNGLVVTYTANLETGSSSGATEHVDGTQIDLLAGPMVRASVSFNGTAATVKEWSVLR